MKKYKDFAEWVAKEIFDEDWEFNKESFEEIACRKLAKLEIVRAKGNEWELINPQEISKVRMTKSGLMNYVGKKVHIYFKDGDEITGILRYADRLEKFGYRKPNYFYIDNLSFKASNVKKIIEGEPNQ